LIELVSRLCQASTKPSIVFIAVAGCIVLSGCSSNDYELGQRIEMGPLAFQVEGASSRLERPKPEPAAPGRPQEAAVGPTRHISVQLRLLSDESRPRIHFGDFLEGGDSKCSGVSFSLGDRSHYKLEDSHGHKFGGSLERHRCDPLVAGGLQLQFRFIPRGEIPTVRNEAFRAEHVDLRTEDCRLIITNPDRRKGQPRSVSIQL